MKSLTDTQKKQYIAAKKRQLQMQREECFDAANLLSKPNPKQETILRDTTSLYKIIRSGNQCLAAGTLVRTPRGNRAIENMKKGDTVFDEGGNKIKVVKTYKNGGKEVVGLWYQGELLVECTTNHRFLIHNWEKGSQGTLKQVSEFQPGDRIVRLDDSPIEVEVKPAGLAETYNLMVDSYTNLYILNCGLTSSNSGKTQTMTRDYAWKLSETHPYWKRRGPDECPHCHSKEVKTENLQIKSYSCMSCSYMWVSWIGDKLVFLCLLQTGKMLEDIWTNRIKPFFGEGEIKAVRQGGILQHVTHNGTGNRIYFFSHDNATEVRKRIQYFAAHDVWIDEMPGDYKVYEELQRRVDAKKGQFAATLTPKVVNLKVKDFIDKQDPTLATLYRMTKLDNPIYAGREEEELAKIKHLPEADQNAILFGDWIFANELRLKLTADKIQDLPDHYSRTWDHVECIDPASAGLAGFILFAKDPADIDTWWVVNACYIKGDAPSILVNDVVPKLTAGYNIVKRVADPHETWFIKESNLVGRTYLSPFDKTHRRKELIGGGEESLVNPKHFIAKGCCEKLEDELNSAEDNPANPGTIKNSTKYHCIDAWLYGLDLLPEYKVPTKPLTVQAQRKRDWLDQRDQAPGHVVYSDAGQQLSQVAPRVPKKNIWRRR